MKKLIAFAGALLLALACSEGQQAPTDVQFAKGGKGGKKVDFEITDYWVTTGANWQNVVHIGGVGSSVEAVGVWLVHDYWHNGFMDDDNSEHFEAPVGFWDSSSTPVTWQGNKWSVDIPWSGQRDSDVDFFRDFIVSDGPDPFVFAIHYRTKKGGRYGYDSPLVTVDGEVLGMEAMVGGQTVYSYAQFQGDLPDGTVVVNALSLSDLTCTHSGSEGAQAYTTIEGVAHAVLNAESWVEFHLIVNGDWTERQTAIGDVIDTVLTTRLPGHVSGPLDVGLVLDYVAPLHEFADWAYDPANNEVDTFTVSQPVDCT